MKWIMVNIMNSQEFSCQILNRDLWSDKEVQKTIRENFYFLQVDLDQGHKADDSTQAKSQMVSDTNETILSINIHISASSTQEQVSLPTEIMLTIGEQVKTWNQIIQPAEFIFELHEFLERFSLSEQARNPIGRKNVMKKVPFSHNYVNSRMLP